LIYTGLYLSLKHKTTFTMKFSATLLAAVAAIPFVNGHIKMTFPVPFDAENTMVDLNPLAPDGSNFPCFVPADKMVFRSDASTLTAGSSAQIKLGGSAVHGGGSCQVSITYDLPPTKDSVYRVLKSFQGGCPETNVGNRAQGNGGEFQLDFQVPSEVAAGKAVLVWTWFNRIGNREMYMRCAPVNIESSETDKNAINDDAKFPLMFKANIGALAGGCKTKEMLEVSFPNAGPNVVGQGSVDNFGLDASTSCATSSAPSPVKPPTTRKPIENSIGGDDEENAPVKVAPVPSATPSAPAAKPSVPATLPTDDVKVELPVTKPAPKPETPAKDETPVKENPAPSPVVKTPVVGGDAGGESCEINGAIYCNGENKFYICNFNKKVDMGLVAAGTKCSNGQITKRNVVRFSSAHLRRRHHHAMKL
jgi:hypothetical protein